jgi:hypothetical protein
MRKFKLLCLVILFSLSGYSQDDSNNDTQKSNIQEYTPSKLLKKGQWDIKFFNSLYTQTKRTDEGSNLVKIPRENFFTNTTEVYTGINDNSRVNIGLIFQVRANTFGGQDAFKVFSFENNSTDARSGFTVIAPSIRFQPIASVPNFSLTSSVYLPLFKDTPNAPYLDKRSVFWETKFFYDKTFGGGDWQIFTEMDLGFNFGEKSQDANPADSNIGERFANNSLFLPFSAFLSYFPSDKSTIFVNGQQAFLVDLGNDFSQRYTQLGFGGKYQLSEVLNLEASFGKFVTGNNFQGLGQTFSLGLRAIF